jgi:hypothetical protein
MASPPSQPPNKDANALRLGTREAVRAAAIWWPVISDRLLSLLVTMLSPGKSGVNERGLLDVAAGPQHGIAEALSGSRPERHEPTRAVEGGRSCVPKRGNVRAPA